MTVQRVWLAGQAAWDLETVMDDRLHDDDPASVSLAKKYRNPVASRGGGKNGEPQLGLDLTYEEAELLLSDLEYRVDYWGYMDCEKDRAVVAAVKRAHRAISAQVDEWSKTFISKQPWMTL